MIVQVIFVVSKCADDVEGVECVTGEAVTETDLSSTGTECLCPLSACGCVEYNLNFAFDSGADDQRIDNALDVCSSFSLLSSVGGRTVDNGDVVITMGNGVGTTSCSYRNGGFEGGIEAFVVSTEDRLGLFHLKAVPKLARKLIIIL